MTATMIFKEIQALPPEEQASLIEKLEVESLGRPRVSEADLFQMIDSIGRRMQTSLSADEMNAARREGRK